MKREQTIYERCYRCRLSAGARARVVSSTWKDFNEFLLICLHWNEAELKWIGLLGSASQIARSPSLAHTHALIHKHSFTRSSVVCVYVCVPVIDISNEKIMWQTQWICPTITKLYTLSVVFILIKSNNAAAAAVEQKKIRKMSHKRWFFFFKKMRWNWKSV